jgi:hypothetical protein
VDRSLHSLDYAGRQHPAFLHLLKERIDVLPSSKRRSENIRGGDSILDREVDPDPAHR